MNKTAMDILSYYGIADEVNSLKHYGVGPDDDPPGRGSGRYPKGSGDNPNQHIGREFYDEANEWKRQGLKDTEIAEKMGIFDKFGKPSSGRYRDMYAAAKNRVRIDNHNQVVRMRDEEGMTWQAIADEMGLPSESSARSLYNGNSVANDKRGQMTADELKRLIEEKGPIDIGAGAAEELSIALGVGITETRLKEALYILEEDGYIIDNLKIPTTNPGQKTTARVIAAPGYDMKQLRDLDNLQTITDYVSHDEGNTLDPVYVYPASLDSKRLQVVHAEEGGTAKDGTIELRRGVDDLSLGKSNYAQVRILVDGTHYIKGMAFYSDDLPPGIDIRFNTNKHLDKPLKGFNEDGTPNDRGILKPIKNDPENPFGSLVKDIDEGGQYYYRDKDGNKKLGLINKTREEGDWETWKDKVPAQFLAKQPQKLIDNQLNLSIADKRAELAEISSLTNPTLKKKMLADFAGKCDGAAVDLKAASFPGQKYHVILPLTKSKDNEVYAPNYEEGTQLALVRFPHAGPYEIPIVRVNNHISEGESMIGHNGLDAMGVSSKVAAQLSGADFDGDTVMAIPISNKVQIYHERPKEKLVDFDPKTEYAERPGMKYMTKNNTQMEMGIISNLITDMYTRGATDEEKIRATKHSMVVIDAEKHKLDYKRSEEENHIDDLKRKYQRHTDDEGYGGASTIISKSKSKQMVDKRQGSPRINPDGTVWYKPADDLYYYDKKGNLVKKQQNSTKMAETNDARTLISDVNNPIEVAYARYANEMKSLATKARKELISTKDIEYNKNAYLAYKNDIDILIDQINEAERNRPRERIANARASAAVKRRMDIWRQDNPSAGKSEYKAEKAKIHQKEISKARKAVGAERLLISLTDRQWDAINQGAMHKSTLEKLFKYADMQDVKRRSMPRQSNSLSKAKEAQIKALMASGYTNKQIAERIGCSTSTVVKYIKGDR